MLAVPFDYLAGSLQGCMVGGQALSSSATELLISS